MSTFNQNNQNIHGNQVNIGGDLIVSFNKIMEKSEIPTELIKIITALNEAQQKGIINAEIVSESKKQVEESINEIQKPNPNVKSVIENLNGAKNLIEGIASAGGLVKIFIEAAEMIRKFFG